MPKIKELQLIDTFTKELKGDEDLNNRPRQVYKAAYSYVTPKEVENPSLIIVADDVLKELGIEDADSNDFLNIISGKEIIPNSKPYAMCYGGHQFGHWAGQLGDGRAINLAEIKGHKQNWTLQLKGAGITPYSRNADGMAVLRSSIREFLCSEAMHYLGIPTTRALSLSLTGEEVLRDVLYNGNPAFEPGAVICRATSSYIRFGSFELFTARKDIENLKELTDYTIKHHYSHLGKASKETYLAFFKEVANRTSKMIIDWQRVGFVHGVMNTDNMSILGQTIDYGPYGWIDNFDPEWTPNTTDNQHKRYRFGNQGTIALWNLTQLANALYPLIEDVPALENILENYRSEYIRNYFKMLNAKLGLSILRKEDESLNKELLELLNISEIDMTIFYRNLSQFNIHKPKDFISIIESSAYIPLQNKANWEIWLQRYAARIKLEDTTDEERKIEMNKVNPKYVLRNYMAQLAIEKAEKKDYSLIYELYNLLKNPYQEQREMEKWFAKRPDWALDKVGSSQLSCSS